MDASRTYGDLVGITFIGRRAVFVSSADKLRALWQDAGDAVSGRIRVGMLDFLNPKFLGITVWISLISGARSNYWTATLLFHIEQQWEKL